MKRLLLLSFLICMTAAIFPQSSDTNGTVTVYTDNGAYVKAKNSDTARTFQIEISFTETYIQNDEKKSVTNTYSFSINPNEEKQLFASQNIISDIKITRSSFTVDMKVLEMEKRRARIQSGQ